MTRGQMRARRTSERVDGRGDGMLACLLAGGGELFERNGEVAGMISWRSSVFLALKMTMGRKSAHSGGVSLA